MHYFVSRHPGALEWAHRVGLVFDRHLTHVSGDCEICAGDIVIGTLPVHLAAALCARGIRYFHLSICIPSGLRGEELSAEQLVNCGASLIEFSVRALATNDSHLA